MCRDSANFSGQSGLPTANAHSQPRTGMSHMHTGGHSELLYRCVCLETQMRSLGFRFILVRGTGRNVGRIRADKEVEKKVEGNEELGKFDAEARRWRDRSGP